MDWFMEPVCVEEGCVLGARSCEVLALGAWMQRLKEPVVHELPKFGRVRHLFVYQTIQVFLLTGLAQLRVGLVVSGYIPDRNRLAPCQASRSSSLAGQLQLQLLQPLSGS